LKKYLTNRITWRKLCFLFNFSRLFLDLVIFTINGIVRHVCKKYLGYSKLLLMLVKVATDKDSRMAFFF
jgi:hypothetical protein